jgi:NAD(P)-dependent dehydrogenase (short-subunit alcohol dehydrogenase family)
MAKPDHQPLPSRVVLITGASSGIGHATAKRLIRRGWMVYATARRPETLDELRDLGCRCLALDLEDEASMQAVVDQIERDHGAVGVLINNAGYSQSGAVESLSMDLWRRQFETNVFGLVRLTQMVLPAMRAQGWGKIVMISSMGGRLTLPGGGAYHASKHALEALSDALRFEVAGFGIEVIVVQPGLVRSEFGETAAGGMVEDAAGGVYADFNAAVGRMTREAYQSGPLTPLIRGPESVAKVIDRAISARRPRARYKVTPAAWILMGLRRWLPDRAWDWAMRTQYPRP